MARTFQDLIGYLKRDNSFPNGVFLLTGTGIVPNDDFTLAPGGRDRNHDRRDRHAAQLRRPATVRRIKINPCILPTEFS